MPAIRHLDPDRLLSTTRAVRKRLDLTRSVEPEVIRECLELALQAPNGGNAQGWRFVVVTDPEKRAKLGEWYRQGFETMYGDREAVLARASDGDPDHVAATLRVIDSAAYLARHMGEVPVHLVPCIRGRTDGAPAGVQAATWGSLFPAVWSFMLAARSRGLGTCLTTLHLRHEADAAELLGIPDHVMQGGLVPVAYTIGTEFKPAPRRDLAEVVTFEQW